MWTAYSTQDAAEFVGMSGSAVRSCVRAGLLTGDRSRLRFSFSDLLVLKMIRDLREHGVSLRRIRRELAELRERLPDATALTSLTLSAVEGHVVVEDGGRMYRADTGQLLFNFGDGRELPAKISEIPVRQEVAGPNLEDRRSAEEWFERAVLLEEEDPEASIRAYGEVLRLRGECPESQINQGRLHAELGNNDAAKQCFEAALAIQPDDATALYNLGVVAQDQEEDDRAIELYHRALELDPSLAEAHYNLATIFDRTGESQAAIRHINEYRKLIR